MFLILSFVLVCTLPELMRVPRALYNDVEIFNVFDSACVSTASRASRRRRFLRRCSRGARTTNLWQTRHHFCDRFRHLQRQAVENTHDPKNTPTPAGVKEVHLQQGESISNTTPLQSSSKRLFYTPTFDPRLAFSSLLSADCTDVHVFHTVDIGDV